MKKDWILSDRVLNSLSGVIERCSTPLNLDVLSIVLYGSRARGEHNSQSEYEIMILLNSNAELNSYIKFINSLNIELLKDKLIHVKILSYTPDNFEDILYNDNTVGTFLYMMCRDNIILFDKFGTFTAIKERLISSEIKKEEVFIEQCVDFARMLGSEKWAQKWEKTLMQFKYLKKRREP